ncbi:recombination protein RecR [Candidatus Parcubacteria bacterium]|nr:recombination protein RecR [Candidatus Parcubacteria bacterium]
MNSIDKLAEIFSHFPGIGPRQAKRFVYYLLSRNHGSTETLIQAIQSLKKEIHQCTECMRFFATYGSSHARNSVCPTCADTSRDKSLLMIVPRDVDFEALEKSRSYKGYYFVLGGSLPILEKDPGSRIRINELKKLLDRRKSNLSEIILAMNANAEGENTTEYLRAELKDLNLTVSELGRGLSTGSELEYADPETLKNALIHRTT